MNITEKLYSPLEFYLHNPREEEANGEYGMYDLYDERYKISCHDAAEHMDAIELAIRRDRDRLDKERGLAEYLNEPLSDKVESIFPSIESYGDMIVCAAEVELFDPLTPEEMAELKDWWGGQLSDAWGEGFEQREIRLGHEELYVVPWTSDDSFHIDTEQEFQRGLGIELPAAERASVSAETPAQAALHEPDASDSEEVAALRERLIKRLDENLVAYFNTLDSNDDTDITDISHEIAAVTEAHYYLLEIHNFHTSELEYLLKFQNPLQVVADEFQMEMELEEHSDIMWNIFDKQDALHGKYELVADTPDVAADEKDHRYPKSFTPVSEELAQAVHRRLDANFADYKAEILRSGASAIFGEAAEIAAVCQSYDYFRNEHAFTTGQAEFLLKFQNPLEFVSDRWMAAPVAHARTIEGVFADQDRTLQKGGYTLVSDEPDRAPTALSPPQKTVGIDERPSVLVRLRQAEYDKRSRPPAQKVKIDRKKPDRGL